MLRILTPRDYRVLPWKNGGGTTTEICIHPEDAGWDDFEWRVGIADIARSGPFSSFPGIDRSILLLECPEDSGMRLTIDGAHVEMPPRQFIDFRGEAATMTTLRGQPVRDFNVMSRRSRIHHERGCLVLPADAPFQLGERGTKFAYVAEGSVRVPRNSGFVAVTASSSFVDEDDAPVELRAGEAGCCLVWAAFYPSRA
jgi:environmental stress-induced protein Ves